MSGNLGKMEINHKAKTPLEETLPNTRLVLIVDDHPLFRDALEMTLTAQNSVPTRIIQTSTVEASIAFLEQEEVHLILLDLNLGDSDGLDGLVKLKAQSGCPPVFIVSASESASSIRHAKSLGADGYVPKSLPMAELSAALEKALSGESWFPEAADDDGVDDQSAAARLSSLTPAQKRVLGYLADGLLNKQIAYEMSISEATVKAHLTTIFRKLHANNRTQALLVFKEAVSTEDHSAN